MQKKQYDWVNPLSYEFKGFKFWTTPPNSQAFLILEILKKIHNEKILFHDIETVQSSVILQMIKLGQNRDDNLILSSLKYKLRMQSPTAIIPQATIGH